MNLNKQQKDKLSLLIGSFVEETAEIKKEIIKKSLYEDDQQIEIGHWVIKLNASMKVANDNDGSTDDQHKDRSAIIKQFENSLIKHIKYNRSSGIGCGCLIVLSPILLFVIYILVTEGF